MIKILHSADWHLDAPMGGEPDLRQALLQVPEKVAALCRAEGCDLLLLAGDLFDGEATAESIHAMKLALREVGVPTFISPGNHDYIAPGSPYLTESWPENVHIFTKPQIESVVLENLDCRIYGAAFDAMDCPALMQDFQLQGSQRYHIGLFHGDPTLRNSPYNPITQAQIGSSGLTYLALGHIHKSGTLRSKETLCAWPGCPMGRGFDEVGEKGVLLVELEDSPSLRFVELDTPRFYDLSAEVLTTAQAALALSLPALGGIHHYRITLTGESEPVDLEALKAEFSQFPHLQLRDHTMPSADLWGCIHQDSLEGVYFKMLHEQFQQGGAPTQAAAQLAAKISRKLLDGREVTLP